jgi:FtsZ-binding cell division protein ZapB
MKYLYTMRIHARHTTNDIRQVNAEQTSQEFVGVLFRFGEVSANLTMVPSDATIRVAGDTMFIEHEYPTIDSYEVIGRIKSYYVKDNALLVSFEIVSEEALRLITSGEKPFLSVSWFSDNYEVKTGFEGTYIEFKDIVIYEVSIVSQPAFSTCVSDDEDGLTCLIPSINKKPKRHCNSGCGCGNKKNGNRVSLSDMVAKHQEVTREEFDALREQVKQALDAIAALAEEVKALKEAIKTPPEELIAELENAKHKLEKVEAELSMQSNNIASVLQAAEKLLDITERTYKNLPNLIRK